MRARFIRFLIFLVLAVRLAATNWYVDSSAAGTHDGTSWTNAWTSFAQITQSSLNGGDNVWVAYRAAAYNEKFTVSKGGTAAATRINFIGIDRSATYSSNRPVLRGVDGSTFGHIGFVNFEITQLGSGNNYRAIALTSGDDWLVEDCYIHDTYQDGIYASQGNVSSNHIIRHNTFNNIGWLSLGAVGDGRQVAFAGDQILIEYNTFGLGLDRNKTFGQKNVIRNNYDSGTGTIPNDSQTLYTGTSPYPFHIDFVQIDRDNAVLSQQVRISRNYVSEINSSTGDAHFVIVQDDGTGSGTFNWYIIDGNLVIRVGEAFSIMQKVNDTFFWNNGAYGIYNLGNPNQPAVTWNSPAGAGSTWANDSFAFSSATMGSTPNIIDSVANNRPSSFVSDYLHRYQIGATGSLPSATHNIGGSAAPSTDPQFTNGLGTAGHDNYTLTIGSPLKSAGGPATTATTTTSGTSLTVAASKGISDGWGVTEGDWIKVGSNSYVQVSSVNTGTNVITGSSSFGSWTSGDPVYLKGMEDVGALPNGSGTVSISSATYSGSTFTVVATNARMVEIQADGLPVGLTYSTTSDGNATFTINASGTGTTYRARAYSMWASATLVAEATATANPPASGSSSFAGSVTATGSVTVR